jgi:DNA-binding FadR family transcriptional regulator
VIRREGRMTEVLTEHRMIVDALEERDHEQAKRVLSEHLAETESVLIEVTSPP